MGIAANIPHDIEQLRIAMHNALIEIKLLKEENALLKQKHFGKQSERLEPGQLQLALGLQEVEAQPPEAEAVTVPEHSRKKQPPAGHGRGSFPAHLPREVIERDVPEAQRCCPACSAEMVAMGTDESEVAKLIPAKLVILQYRLKKYGCPKGHAIVTATKPPQVIQGGKYDASVHAFVVTSKYSDHLPLNRIEGIAKRIGIELPKQTQWDLLVQFDTLAGQALVGQMRKEIRDAEILMADETPMDYRCEGPGGGTLSKQGYLWVWRTPGRGEPPKVLVEFKLSRGREGPWEFLKGRSPVLLCDGYSGYDLAVAENEIVRAGCWAHERRYFKEALDTGEKSAARVLQPIQRLFRIERAISKRIASKALELPGADELRLRIRRKRSRPVVESILRTACDLEALPSTLPKSKLGKAITYLLNQKKPLTVCLDEPRIPIHNNDTERDVRHPVLGRKNYLIFASPKGGEVAARLYSLVLSARLIGINLQDYIENVLRRFAENPKLDPAQLTPWAWAAEQGPLSPGS